MKKKANLPDETKCIRCLNCINICSNKAIVLKKNFSTFYYPVIKNSCINCGKCNNFCPIKSTVELKKVLGECYSFSSKNNTIKENSSSGAFFYELSTVFLKNNQNSIIIGSTYDDNWNLKYSFATNIDEIIPMQKSKYVESNLNDIFNVIKNYLKKNYHVLFTGTPCSIAALYTFLKNENIKNLYTLDFICHGVPSPFFFHKYLRYLEKKYKSQITNIDFRNKELGWYKYNLKIEFKNNVVLKTAFYLKEGEGIYRKLFSDNISLRKSCYTCKYKGKNHVADITIGDFWGIKKTNPTYFDEMGVSAIIIKTQKGNHLFDMINHKNAIISTVSYSSISDNNPNLETNPVYNKKSRFLFLILLNFAPISFLNAFFLLLDYTKRITILNYIKNLVKRIKYTVKKIIKGN